MKRVSLSGAEKSIEAIWDWYENQKKALFDFREKIFSAIINSSNSVDSKFVYFTADELNNYFQNSEKELEHLVCFDLISATEGILRSDFHKRVYNKDKSDIGKIFREIEKNKNNKISLEADIIDNWKEIVTERKNDFSNFLRVLNYRNWLAHGRYWTPKLGQAYTPLDVYKIAEKISEVVSSMN